MLLGEEIEVEGVLSWDEGDFVVQELEELG